MSTSSCVKLQRQDTYRSSIYIAVSEAKLSRMLRIEPEGGTGVHALLSPIGAALATLYVPDKEGNNDDIVLGFEGSAMSNLDL